MAEHIKIELDFIPVEERLPEGNMLFILLSEDARWSVGYYYRTEKEWREWTGTSIPVRVTHWAEIPEMK